jgi:hypothetical protein
MLIIQRNGTITIIVNPSSTTVKMATLKRRSQTDKTEELRLTRMAEEDMALLL